jgi:hypothetical protein
VPRTKAAKVALGVCLVCTCVSELRLYGQGPPTLDQIIEGLERAEKTFFESDSFLIRYERVKTQDTTPTAYSGGFLLAEWTFAHKGNKWLNQRRFTHPMKTKELLVEGKPNTLIAKGPVMLEWQQEFQSAYISEFAKGGKIYQGLFYTRNLSLDAPKYIAKANGGDIKALRKMSVYSHELALPFLPEFLRENKARYTVLSAPEEIDKSLCWVVEWPGMDRFWVDPRRGYAVPRRAYCFAPGKPLMFEFRHSDYREVKPGLWLPFVQTEDRYADEAEKQVLWGKVAARSEYHVHVAQFDGVSDDTFDAKLLAGTKVFDWVRGFQYNVSPDADADPFSEAIAAAKKHKMWSQMSWLALGVGSVLALLVVFFVYRGRWSRKLRKNR